MTNSNLGLLYNWQDYLSDQVPVIWQPLAVYELTEIAKNLRRVIPQRPDARNQPGRTGTS